MAALNFSIQVGSNTFTLSGTVSASDATRWASELKTYYNVGTDSAAADALLKDLRRKAKDIVDGQLNQDAVSAVTPIAIT